MPGRGTWAAAAGAGAASPHAGGGGGGGGSGGGAAPTGRRGPVCCVALPGARGDPRHPVPARGPLASRERRGAPPRPPLPQPRGGPFPRRCCCRTRARGRSLPAAGARSSPWGLARPARACWGGGGGTVPSRGGGVLLCRAAPSTAPAGLGARAAWGLLPPPRLAPGPARQAAAPSAAPERSGVWAGGQRRVRAPVISHSASPLSVGLVWRLLWPASGVSPPRPATVRLGQLLLLRNFKRRYTVHLQTRPGIFRVF